MANLKDDYKNKVKTYQPKPPYFKNCLKAFIVGGLICAFGQAISNMYINFFHFTEKTAGNPTVATLILISALLTGFGIYDRIGQFAGAGSAVPVTGFANSMTSAALEHRSEGIVLGVATNMFKLAGSVIVFGVVAAYVVGIIRYVYGLAF
ncbi:MULTISPECIES: stage V sporulation protein AC [Metabacillus]|uniref:Stage V sporulation protein AC n=1 Tax=Metabacillus indicus TaxID=246786 RepID=A0A084GVX8_METID|nr:MULTISPECIES: stage V sporulation protein AC [Metabacillus]KEZ50806.1 stage V sporulation protein AC [Metabacillus indicus LMG 22858]KEZ51490.1 stage V sporulation protein AC [Metabacillus indicus]